MEDHNYTLLAIKNKTNTMLVSFDRSRGRFKDGRYDGDIRNIFIISSNMSFK